MLFLKNLWKERLVKLENFFMMYGRKRIYVHNITPDI